MSIFLPLTIGKQGLLAHERAIGVTGHNITNANSKGYSRQSAVLTANRPDDAGFGTGVQLKAVERSVDQFLDARILASDSNLGGATTGRQLLDRLQALFPVGDEGVGNALAEFFAAAQGVADSPQDLAARSQLLEAGKALTAQIRNAAGGIQTLQREADQRVQQETFDANSILQNLAQLNREILAAERAGRETNDLRDQRQVALGDLANHISITVVELDDGLVNVFASSGQGLLIGGDAATLATEQDLTNPGLDGSPLSRIGIALRDGSIVSLSGAVGGSIGSLLELRDQTFTGNAAQLDALAVALRDGANAVQTDPAGRDLNGVVGTAFFGGTAAADLDVALSDPRAIAAGRGTDPADNTNALAFAGVAQQRFAALGNATLGDYFATVHAAVGQLARRADDSLTVEETVAAGLAAQRESISGVSLDEEFTDLIRFQRGFQAAAQLINVSNVLLDDLLGLVR